MELWTSAKSIFGFFFGKKIYPVTISILILLIVLYAPLKDSIVQQDVSIFLKSAGNMIVGADLILYNSIEYYQVNAQVLTGFQKFMASLNILGSVWFLFVIFRFTYYLVSMNDNSKTLHNLIMMIILIALFQVAYFSIMTSQFYPPFKGVWSFIVHSEAVITPLSRLIRGLQFST